jgi:hypothetical protein
MVGKNLLHRTPEPKELKLEPSDWTLARKTDEVQPRRGTAAFREKVATKYENTKRCRESN